jgi:hypothetical protein
MALSQAAEHLEMGSPDAIGPPVFIGGINRSGTSMVRAVLGSHPDLALPPTEFEFFKRTQAWKKSHLSDAESTRLIYQALRWPKVEGWGLRASDVEDPVRVAGNSPGGVFAAFLESHAAQRGKPRFGDKTTYSHRRLATFDRWFPAGYGFVHVLRHPVESYASSLWYGGTEHRLDPRAWSRDWVESALIALRRARKPRDGYTALRYEDVCAEPERWFRQICRAVGLEYDPRMIEMADFEEKDNSRFPTESGHYIGQIRQSDGIRRSSFVAEDEAAEIRRRCGRVAAALGYDVYDESAIAEWRPGRIADEVRFRADRARRGGRRAGRLLIRR